MDSSSAMQLLWIDKQRFEAVNPPQKDRSKRASIVDKSEVPNASLKAAVEKRMEMKSLDPSVQELYQVLAALKPGQLHPRVVQWEKEYWIVQVLEVEPTRKKIKVIGFPKRDYFDWQAEQFKQQMLRVEKEEIWKRR